MLTEGEEKCRRKGKEEEGIETAKRSFTGKNGGEGTKGRRELKAACAEAQTRRAGIPWA